MFTASHAVLVDVIQRAKAWAHAIVINPGGYSHTSVAIRDATSQICESVG